MSDLNQQLEIVIDDAESAMQKSIKHLEAELV
jgi:hypothetical protein